jgi:hypothetical protein
MSGDRERDTGRSFKEKERHGVEAKGENKGGERYRRK